MRAYIAFVKKEFTEFTRTYRLLTLLLIFLLLGLMNPLTAKLIPVILDNFMPEGVTITLGEPTALDSWMQFYKNVPQMGLIVAVLLYGGLLSQEFQKDTLVNMLTKGLPRRTVLLSKLTMAIATWTLAYGLCFGVTWAYTAYFWDGAALSHIPFAALCLWLFGIMLITAVLLGSTLFINSYGSLLFTGGLVCLLAVMGIFPQSAKYSPLSLAGRNMELIGGGLAVSALTVPILFALLLSAVFVVLSVAVFDRKAM